MRPGFDRLMKDAISRKIDLIAAWSVDRLGRRSSGFWCFLTELQALRCHLYLHQQALDTTTPSGRAMFQMLGVADRGATTTELKAWFGWKTDSEAERYTRNADRKSAAARAGKKLMS